MKQWRCTICNYIHEGESPPLSCPVCKAPASKFVLLEQEASSTVSTVDSSSDLSDAEKIRQLEEQIKVAKQETTSEKTRALSLMDSVMNQMVKHHIHPVSVHFPNGVLPVAVIFFVAAFLFGANSLATAGFFNVIAVFVSLPLVIAAGFVEWTRKYNSALTWLFKVKILAASVTLVTCFASLVWYASQPGVLGSSLAWLFLLLNIVMLASAGVAGFLGGKLVFKD